MTREEAARLYALLLAIWPAAKNLHDEDTVRVWLYRLERLDLETATEALESLASSCRNIPSIADLQAAVSHAVTRRRQNTPAPPVGPPVRSEFARRFLDAARAALGHNRDPIVARDLDNANIPNWQWRLEDANRRDSKDGSLSRRHLDAAWTAIRGEFYAAQKKVLTAGTDST